MISLNNISLMRGNQLDRRQQPDTGGQRTGIIGRNGAGTSLFKALEGEIPLEQGAIELPNGLRTSTMSQETPGSQRSALEFVIDADTAYRTLERALQQAEVDNDHAAMANSAANLTTSRATAFATGLSSYFQGSASVTIYSISR